MDTGELVSRAARSLPDSSAVEKEANYVAQEVLEVVMTHLARLGDDGWERHWIASIMIHGLQLPMRSMVTMAVREELARGDYAKAKRLMLRLCADADASNRKACLAYLKSHAAGNRSA